MGLALVALVETSDVRLKQIIKKCYDVVKYIQPKTYNSIKDEDTKKTT